MQRVSKQAKTTEQPHAASTKNMEEAQYAFTLELLTKNIGRNTAQLQQIKFKDKTVILRPNTKKKIFLNWRGDLKQETN